MVAREDGVHCLVLGLVEESECDVSDVASNGSAEVRISDLRGLVLKIGRYISF